MRLKLYRGYWAVVGTDESGKVWRRSLRTRDRATAERQFHDYRKKSAGDTVEDAVLAYLEEKRGIRSHGSMQTSWRALRPYFGQLRPDQISRANCRDYAANRIHAGVREGTVIKDLGVLRAAIRFAKGRGGGGATFQFPPTPAPRERYITREEHQRLLDACGLPHLRLFVLLAWSTAARASAIFDLTWDRVDFERGLIRLSKGEGRRKGRAIVPMGERLTAAMKEAYEARTCEHVIEWGGGPVKSVKRGFAEACRKAGLENVTPHALRHSAAVAMAEAGVSMAEIAQYLGHTNPAVTFRVYARYSPDHLRKAMKALE